MHQGAFASTDGSFPSFIYSQLILVIGDHGQCMEEKITHRELLLAVFSVLTLLLDPSEWPIVPDSWSQDWKKWAKWQHTPYCHSIRGRGSQNCGLRCSNFAQVIIMHPGGEEKFQWWGCNCLNASLRSDATQSHSQWMAPSWERSPLFCRLARQFTALSQNICAINFHSTTWKYFHLSWYYRKAEHWQKWMSSDKLGKLEQPLLLPPFYDFYTHQFSFPMQQKSSDLRVFNHTRQVTMSVF